MSALKIKMKPPASTRDGVKVEVEEAESISPEKLDTEPVTPVALPRTQPPALLRSERPYPFTMRKFFIGYNGRRS